MNKIYAKLIVISLALTLAVAMVVMSSYAWVILSTNPAVSGIQVAIGGGNTILVAPDLTAKVDGVTYHYPGSFSDKLNFSQYESYDYLKTLGGLTPVSTADGLNWFLPTYYGTSDPLVQAGKIASGELKPIEEFAQDIELTHANLTAKNTDAIREGSYYYMDFWVVSPGAEYTLRISTGDDSGGSFLIDLLRPEEVPGDTTGTGYTLAEPEHQAAAAARVGFLVNPDRIIDNTMVYYQDSPGFDTRYTQLRGSYHEPNSGVVYSDSYRFTVFEPNGNYHPTDPILDGAYVPTRPVGLVNGKAAEVPVLDRTAVQKKSVWLLSDNGRPAIEQIFQTSIFGKDLTGMDAGDIFDAFYGDYLQGQISPYVDRREGNGAFYKRSGDLASYYGTVSEEDLAQLDTAGATDDVYLIELERNVPQRIRMFIWLEGQDVDCVNSVNTSSFAVSIELAGSNQNES